MSLARVFTELLVVLLNDDERCPLWAGLRLVSCLLSTSLSSSLFLGSSKLPRSSQYLSIYLLLLFLRLLTTCPHPSQGNAARLCTAQETRQQQAFARQPLLAGKRHDTPRTVQPRLCTYHPTSLHSPQSSSRRARNLPAGTPTHLGSCSSVAAASIYRLTTPGPPHSNVSCRYLQVWTLWSDITGAAGVWLGESELLLLLAL
jgi:hypothetical protein